MTVWDGISDLIQAQERQNAETDPGLMPYAYDDGKSFYQRLMRQDNGQYIEDCVSRAMTDLQKLRISLIPTLPGADWRDLPNVKRKYGNGKVTTELHYGLKDIGAREEKYK